MTFLYFLSESSIPYFPLLQIKIFTGETTDRYLTSLRGRAGHTFKKMIQAYENGMQ